MSKFKNSFRFRMVAILIGIIAGIVMVGTVIYSASLTSFYVESKSDTLIDVYEDMNHIYVKDATSGLVTYKEDSIQNLRQKGYNRGIQMIIVDTSYNLKFANVPSEDETNMEYLLVRLRELIFNVNVNGDVTTVIESGENYKVNRYKDASEAIDCIEMWGELDCGYFFIMRVTTESINEMADIANHFYIQFAIIMTVGGVLMMGFVAARMTKPIKELAILSKKMSNLEFDAKYTGDAMDEIGVLGASMNELSRELEKTISELKTANNELQKDIEKKTEIDELRKEFISNVSHELKTPIAIIQGYAEGLKESVNEDSDSRDFYCDVIVDEATKMNKMVRKLMTLNQIEFGNVQSEFERFDIVQTIDYILNQTHILLEDKRATVDFDNTKSVYVWSDEFQIEEVITNYICNAIHYVDNQRIIRITVKDENGIVRVSVENTGENIPEESIGRIWEKFYKVDKARSREYGGSGIGLSIVKAIMDSIHMKCGVENRENGVEFWFEVESATEGK